VTNSFDVSLQQARCLQLAAQGLLQPSRKVATRAALRACIERMGLLQIDTIHVVARSPYMVLFSRIGAYPQAWLDDALAQGALFETWAHEACFAPIGHLHHHRVFNREVRKHWGLVNAQKSHAKQRAELDNLLAHIRGNGPVKSSDFQRTDSGGSPWWGWKDEKRWLEALFATGELMVARREKFQRVYDLAERVAPQLQATLDNVPSLADVSQTFTEKSVAALGITQARWVHDYYRSKPRLKDADLNALVEQGRLLRVQVEGWSAPAYVHSGHAALLKKARANQLYATHSALLSPFDPIVWDRERALALFDFDYRLECYTPEARRVHGYFVLPILCRGELIGRLDAKAHRTQGVFEVKALHAQSGCVWSKSKIDDVVKAIQACADWHGTPQVTIGPTQPAKMAPALRRALRALSHDRTST
jgi:uncharacterized protein YcaQ